MQPLEYTKFDDVCDKYQDYLMKLYKERGMREDSVSSYLSRLRVLRKWKEVEKVNLFYSYQFNKNIVGQFLDYIFIDRNNTIRTRNNYLTWLKVFCKYLVERGYVPNNPTEGMSSTQRNSQLKNRDVIPDKVMMNIKEWLNEHNKHFFIGLLHLTLSICTTERNEFLKGW